MSLNSGLGACRCQLLTLSQMIHAIKKSLAC